MKFTDGARADEEPGHEGKEENHHGIHRRGARRKTVSFNIVYLNWMRRLKPSPYLLRRVLLAVTLQGYRGHSEVIVSLLTVRIMRNFPSEHRKANTGLVYFDGRYDSRTVHRVLDWGFNWLTIN